jgi:hypothetical protein
MAQKARQREEGLRRKREHKAKADAEAAKLAGTKGGLKNLFKQKTLNLDELENTRLVQKLRQWKLQKKEYEKMLFQKKV